MLARNSWGTEDPESIKLEVGTNNFNHALLFDVEIIKVDKYSSPVKITDWYTKKSQLYLDYVQKEKLDRIAEKDKEIAEKDREIAKKDNEIMTLKREIDELKNQGGGARVPPSPPSPPPSPEVRRSEVPEFKTAFEGHTNWVRRLIVHNNILYSGSVDRTICAWQL